MWLGMDNRELKHYGIPGMKWGVRKFIERHDKGKKIVKYLAAPAAAYQVTKQATEEYNYQMKNRKKNKSKK